MKTRTIYYTTYKITNNINGKFYVGMHKTANLDDGYYGSGTVIKRAIEKYGISNFTKEYLSIFDNEAQMIQAEVDIVTEDFVNNPNTYNLRVGGIGGFPSDIRERCADTFRSRLKNDPIFLKQMQSHGVKMFKNMRDDGITSSGFTGKVHSNSTKELIGKANSKHQSGSGNSQYGTCWIHSLTLKESKRIKKDDLNDWISKGWVKGRKMKF